MAKVRITAIPKMQTGGYAPISTQERDNWERMQSAAHQQGFYGDDRNKQPGIDFMRKYGIDPSRLPAYQQDFQNLQGANPIKGEGQTRATHGQYSGVDDIYGKYTSGQRYTHYQIDNNGQLSDYGTDFNAFKANSDALQAKRNAGWEGFGDPKSDINYRAPVAAVQPAAPVGLAATGFPTREEAIAKYKSRNGAALPSNYFAGDRSSDGGDPIGKLRSTGEETFRMGGNVGKRRVRITAVPAMANGGTVSLPGGQGGYGNQQVGHGYALDPHVMQKGGSTKQNPPIYTNDINDPKLKPYQDSLNLYNQYLQDIKGKNLKRDFIYQPGSYLGNSIKPIDSNGNYRTYKERMDQSYPTQFKPTGFYSNTVEDSEPDYSGRVKTIDNDPYNPTGGFSIIPVYKKPLQPYIYDNMTIEAIDPFTNNHHYAEYDNMEQMHQAMKGNYPNGDYDPDRKRKKEFGGSAGNSSNFEVGKHYDLHPSHVRELMNQGYDITIL